MVIFDGMDVIAMASILLAIVLFIGVYIIERVKKFFEDRWK